MLSEMKQTFIEAAARTMWRIAYNDHAENTCRDCGHSRDVHSRSDGQCEGCAAKAVEARQSVADAKARGDNANYSPGLRNLDRRAQHAFARRDPLPTDADAPDCARLEAAILLGKLEQANGCSLEVIVEAATAADRLRSGGGGTFCSQCGRHINTSACGPTHTVRWAEYVAAFASAVALEALGTGVKWTDNHGRFALGSSTTHYADCVTNRLLPMAGYWVCNCGAASGRPFVVPSIEFEYEEPC